MGTNTAAAFPGLQDRLVHFTSAPVSILAGDVEDAKLDDEDAPMSPTAVEAGNVADAP
jgi:hypothetical protein